jgi:hypothetical protein
VLCHSASTLNEHWLCQECLQTDRKPFPISCFALPNSQTAPAKIAQAFFVFFVPDSVPLQLWPPILLTGRRHMTERAAIMIVPKTTMHLNHPLESGENQVWTPWQFVIVKTIAETHAMNEPAN